MIPRAAITAWRRTAPWADDAQVEANMAVKVTDPSFLSDVAPLLRTGIAYEPSDAWNRVHAAIVAHLPGAAWKGVPDAN